MNTRVADLAVSLLVVAAATLMRPTTGLTQIIPTGRSQLAAATMEDYRTPVGRLEGGVLRVMLEARPAVWYPWGGDGPGLLAHVFAADGAPARTPGPLIRVTVGTPVRVTIRNDFEHTLVVRGLRRSEGTPEAVGRPPAPDSAMVAPGATQEVRLTPAIPGTYIYSGHVAPPTEATVPRPMLGIEEGNRSFIGVLIVDPPGAPPPGERIFLITHWADREVERSFLPATRFFINGRSWPHTERLEYAQGDTVRWRVLNMTGRPHPMHLHGFYFTVDASGDLLRGTETVYPPGMRRLAVTEALPPARSMRISWVPREPGNWIFHCHFMRHMSRFQSAPIGGEAASHQHAGHTGDDLMGGLVLGISIQPDPAYVPAGPVTRRRVPLFIGMRPGFFGEEPAYSFVVQEGAVPPSPDSVRFPGSPIVLTRGEPTEIVIRNQADVPLGVHWHGLEVESWADGVPGWSGSPDAIRPAVAPGDSFVVRITPPQAGSFMYHVHSEPGHQFAQGLYGAFLVMEPGEPWDPEVDRVFLLGSLGGGTDAPPAVNGESEPRPVELRAGTTYRLRFMHISPDDDKQVTLSAGNEPVAWRMVAKDGADLPPSQARTQPAMLRIHVGETYDFEWRPETPGQFTLRIATTFDQGVAAFRREAPPPHTANVLVRVR